MAHRIACALALGLVLDRNECHDRAMDTSMQPHVRRLAAMLRTWQRKHHDPLVVKIAP